MPVAIAATTARAASMVAKAARSPSPSTPSRFSAGTQTSSRCIRQVGSAPAAIFLSRGPNETPGRVRSTTKLETPRAPGSVPVRAMTL